MQKKRLGLVLALSISAASLFGQALDTAFLYRIGTSADPSLSLALANVEAQNRPVMRTTADHPTQLWEVKKDKYGNFKLVNFRLGKAYQMELVNDANKDKLTLADVKNLASQAWKIVSNGNGTYRISSLWIGPEKALEVSLPGDGKITELKLVATTKAANQMWTFSRVPKPQVTAPVTKPTQPSVISLDPNSYYRLSTQWQGEAKVLALEGNTPKLKSRSDDRSQFWKLIPEANGYFRLVNEAASGKCFDVVNDGAANNRLSVVAQSNYSGQFWKLTPDASGNFFRFTNQWQGEGKSLDVLNNGNKDEVFLSASGNYSGQSWRLTPSALPPPVQQVVTSTPNPGSPTESKSILLAGEELKPDMKLYAPSGQYTLIQQTDGNLVLYDLMNKPLWSSKTWGKKVTRCAMQPDGNLVLYDASGAAVWASNTHGNPGSFLSLENSGNLVIYSKNKQKLWSSGNKGE